MRPIKLVSRVLYVIGYPFSWLLFSILKVLRWIFFSIARLVRARGNWRAAVWSWRFPVGKWHDSLRSLKKKKWKLRFPRISLRLSFARKEKPKQIVSTAHVDWSQRIAYDWIDPPYRSNQTVWKVAALATAVCLALGSLTGWWIYQAVFRDLPSIVTLETRRPAATTHIFDRHGRLLYKVFEEENRTPVALDRMSPYLVQATLAIEDEQFYEHWGYSLRGMSRALWHNLNNDTTHGGSTITQQLVKNTLLSRERTVQRKVREVILAIAVDAQYSKAQIFEWYLNDVNYGGAIYGAEEASQWFFGKSAENLTLAESALLAGLPNAPTLYNPFGPDPQRSRDRQAEVLRRMQELGFITQEQRDAAQNETLTFRSGTFDIQAPHFVMMIRDQLAQQYGEEAVAQGGLQVWTTLDLDLQASAEAAVSQELERIGRLNVSNGAALVTNPKSGEVLAMVGSRNYFDTAQDGQVNVVLSERQPGSSIKPFTYALAFERGWSPSSMIEDSPVQFTSPGSPPYVPKNYDGSFHGNVTLREALGSSYNIPAVRLLANVGVSSLVRLGQQVGLTTWSDPSRFGLALTLGGGEVRMYDMAQAYGTFANDGQTVPLNPIMEIKNVHGEQIYKNPCVDSVEPCNGEQVLKPLTATQITNVLSDNGARSPAFGSRSALVIPNQEVAVKTGTTNSLRDNWTIGYTKDRVVLTWVGNNDNRPMSSVASGVTGASPIWNKLMTHVLTGQQHRFALPAGMQRVRLCAVTGTLACNGCPKVVEELLPTERVPQTICKPEDFANMTGTPSPTPGLATR